MDITNEKDSSRGLKIIIAILLLLMAMVIFLVGFILVKGGGSADISDIFKGEIKEETYDLEEFVVNLQPENGRTKNYAKIKVSLMYNQSKDGKILEEHTSKIRDKVTNILRAKTATEMIKIENIEDIKISLKEEINKSLGKDIVKDVYITDIVIQ